MAQLLTVDQVLQEGKCYRVSWYDTAHTIMLMEIFGPWTWEDAFASVPKINEWVAAETHPVYTVFYYHLTSTSLFPRGANGLTNIRKLVEIDPPNEQLVFFVRQDSLTRQFMNIVSKTYGFRHFLKKYRFLSSLDEALAQIEQHKAAQKISSPSSPQPI